ncbi:hypothetical protein D3C71_1677700 [compost metagenome]
MRPSSVGLDGFALLDAIDAKAPEVARQAPKVIVLSPVWQTPYESREVGPPRWRDGAEFPPVGERNQSPYDPEMHYSAKRGMEWSGYKGM